MKKRGRRVLSACLGILLLGQTGCGPMRNGEEHLPPASSAVSTSAGRTETEEGNAAQHPAGSTEAVTAQTRETGASGGGDATSSAAAAPTTGGTKPMTVYTSDPLKDPYDAAAYSGENGRVYYIKWNSLMNEYRDSAVDVYDLMAFVTSLQGVLNREKPTLYIDWHGSVDLFWYKYMKREGKLLYGCSETAVTSVAQLLEVFRQDIVRCGLTEWDPAVMATSNVAATICSATDALPLRSGTAFTRRVKEETGAAVKNSLVGKFTGRGLVPDTGRASTGSKKGDAYLWAMDRYMDQLNGTVAGFLMDANQAYGSDLKYTSVTNRDYVIAERGFVFDLSPWDDEAPADDPEQKPGTDYQVLLELFSRLYQKNRGEIFTVCGYVPWHKKYTAESGTSRHGAIESEWRFCDIISSFNAILDADSAEYSEITNASLYRLYPLKSQYSNPQPENGMKYDPGKKYVYLYMGDYDSSSWVKQFVPKMWNDPARGSLPIAWAFNANLAQRIPMAYDYLFEYKTAADTFISGDSGAGYLFPSILIDKTKSTHSTCPSGADAFVRHNKKWLGLFQMDFIGLIVNPGNPFGGAEAALYERIAPRGGIFNLGGTVRNPQPVRSGDALFLPHTSDMPEKDRDPKTPQKNGDFILRHIQGDTDFPFYMFRTILWTPSEIKALQEYVTAKSGGQVVFCTPQDFMRLAREAGK